VAILLMIRPRHRDANNIEFYFKSKNDFSHLLSLAWTILQCSSCQAEMKSESEYGLFFSAVQCSIVGGERSSCREKEDQIEQFVDQSTNVVISPV